MKFSNYGILVQIKKYNTVWFKKKPHCRWLVCNRSSERCNTGSVFNFEAIVRSNLGGVLVVNKSQYDEVWIFRVSESEDLSYHLGEFGPTQLAGKHSRRLQSMPGVGLLGETQRV